MSLLIQVPVRGGGDGGGRPVGADGFGRSRQNTMSASNRGKTRAPAPASASPPPRVTNSKPAPIMSYGYRLDVSLGAIAATPELEPDDLIIATSLDMPSSRRKTVRIIAAVPDVDPVNCVVDVLCPSGRFDALVDMGNPMKGINLFPYLRRRREGRALRAVGPAVSLELSRTVCEAALPRRWPQEVFFFVISVYNNLYLHRVDVNLHLPTTLLFFPLYHQLLQFFFYFVPTSTVVARRLAAYHWFSRRSTRPVSLPNRPSVDPRRGLPPRGGSTQLSCGRIAGH